jgi:urease gamma subunit
MTDHALTVRLPDKVYRAARNMAERQGISLNRLVQQAIAEKAGKSVKHRLEQAYDLLADDPLESNVEEALSVQVEAVFRD